MFSNYLFIALQGLKKQPGFSTIKIFSLALGLGASILVFMHVQYSYGFDKHFPNWERTYRLVTSYTADERLDTVMTSDAYAPQMRLDYPQIEHMAKIRRGQGLFTAGGDNVSILNAYHWTEPDIIDIFSLDFIAGDPDTALDAPYTIIINETTARKYFPDQSALGKTLTHDNPTLDLRVTGVFRDFPENSHIDLQILVSVETGRQLLGEYFMGGNSWIDIGGTMTYLTLPSEQEGEAIARDLDDFLDRNLPEQQRASAAESELALGLQPLGDIYLSPRQGFGQEINTHSQVLAGLAVFAALILIASCINFANLSVSQIAQRRKEIGVRKTLGAKRGHIIVQFLFESVLLTLLALLAALPLVYFAIPVYTNLTGTNFTAASVLNTASILGLLVFVLATGIISGLLPALALSNVQVSSILKSVGPKGPAQRFVRPAITVLQFTLSSAMVIFALGVGLQINFLNAMDIGFQKDNLIVMDSTFSNLRAGSFDFTAMKNEFEQHPGVMSVAQSNVMPPNTGTLDVWHLPGSGPNESRTVSQYVVDPAYVETMGLELLAGRDFSERFTSDFINLAANQPLPTPEAAGTRGILMTRSGVSIFGFASPEAAINEIVLFTGEEYRYRIIGVIEDFYLGGGLEDTFRSTSILRASLDPMRVLLIRVDPDSADSVLGHIDSVWDRHRPDAPIDRTFYNEIFNGIVYEQTNGISTASVFAGIITVLIAVFGLYALAFYSGQRRTKEIGVRKVLGASSKSVIFLLAWDLVKPVLIACLLAWVVGYYGISLYLEQFASRASISPFLYIAVTLATVLLAFVTVASQCFKAASSDPVSSLRYE